MSDSVIDEVLFALQRQRDAYEANGADNEAALYEKYCDAVHNGQALVNGARLSAEEIKTTSWHLASVSSPHLLSIVLPYSRQQSAYRSVMRLMSQVGRVAQGKPPRKLFGIFG